MSLCATSIAVEGEVWLKPRIRAVTGWSDATVRRRELAEEFPKRIQLGNGKVGWLASEVRTFLRRRERGIAPKPLQLSQGASG